MFGLSWGQIAIIVLVGVFVLGPERIPTAVTWVLTSLRKVRTMAAGAQAELRREIGPEIEELRRQVADLQSLKEIQELRDLRDLHPKRLIGKNILGDGFSGGITGFLGLNEPVTANGGAANGTTDPNDARSKVAAVDDGAPTAGENPGAVPAVPPHLPPSMTKPSMPQPSMSKPSLTALAAPKLVGSAGARPARVPLTAGERPPFDPDGT